MKVEMSSRGHRYASSSNRYGNDHASERTYKDNEQSLKEKNVSVTTKNSYKTRLFIGNLPLTLSEEKFDEIFKNYKVENKHMMRGKGYGFVQLTTREEAEKVRRELDGQIRNGKMLRVKISNPTAALKVRNLGPYISNEMLHQAFSMFGEVERAVVIADDKGRSLGEGIVEFASKRTYFSALRACTETCFLINNSLQPVIVEEFQVRDEEGGVPESSLTKHIAALQKDREKPPRIVQPGSFEFEYASRWKKLFEVERIKKEAIDKEMEEAKARLLEDIEAAYYEHQANVLREQLKEIEEKSTMFQRTKTMRLDQSTAKNPPQWQEEQIRIQEEQRRLQEDRIFQEEQRMQEEWNRRQQHEEELRRREMMMKEEEAYRIQMSEGLTQGPEVMYQAYADSPQLVDNLPMDNLPNNQHMMGGPEMMPQPPPAPNMDVLMRGRSRSRDRHRRSPPRRARSKDRIDSHRRAIPERRSRSRRRRR